MTYIGLQIIIVNLRVIFKLNLTDFYRNFTGFN